MRAQVFLPTRNNFTLSTWHATYYFPWRTQPLAATCRRADAYLGEKYNTVSWILVVCRLSLAPNISLCLPYQFACLETKGQFKCLDFPPWTFLHAQTISSFEFDLFDQQQQRAITRTFCTCFGFWTRTPDYFPLAISKGKMHSHNMYFLSTHTATL